MIAQYTAASLVNENRVLATPASAQSVPVSADQEDHISMATYAARKLEQLVTNAVFVTAIEFFAAAQAIDLQLQPQKSMPQDTLGLKLASIYDLIRQDVPFIGQDAVLSGHVKHIAALIADGQITQELRKHKADLLL